MTDYPFTRFVTWHAERISLWHNWFGKLPSVVRESGGGKRVPEQLKRWTEAYPKLEKWVRGASDALSPRQTLDLPHFAAWPQEFRERAANWIHDHFMTNCRVGGRPLAELIATLLKCLRDLNGDVTGFLALQGRKLDPDECNILADKIERLSALRRQVPDQISWPQPVAQPLPEILVVDDLLGRPSLTNQKEAVLHTKAIAKLEEIRRAFCQQFRLIDNDLEGNLASNATAVARAHFCSGQRWDKEKGFVNDLANFKSAVKRRRFALILLDVVFNAGLPNTHGEGPENSHFGTEQILKWFGDNPSDVPVVVLTSRSAGELIRDVRSRGFQYLHRNHASDVDLIFHLLRAPEVSPAQLRAAMAVPDRFVAEDPRMLGILFRVWKEARDESRKRNLLILGESGVGKEELARFMFESSPRTSNLFVEVNCAQFQGSVQLANSSLFGHIKGAFTDAKTDRLGAFRTAHDGVLFLDEVGELPLEVQAKLLRVLETGRVSPEGADRPVPADVRLIAATNRNLEEMVQAKTFREDLLYRLSEVTVEVPPLHDRRADIVPIAKYWLDMEHRQIELDAAAGQFLTQLEELPGNVRHLRKLLDEAAVGMTGPNVLLKMDIEAAWQKLQKPKEERKEPSSLRTEIVPTQYLPQVDRGEEPPKKSVIIQDVAGAVELVLRSATAAEGWDSLSKAQIRAINKYLEGNISSVIAALVNWSLYCGTGTPDIARYLTGKNSKQRYAQDVVGRFLNGDGVAEHVRAFVNRPGNETLKQNAVLQRLISKKIGKQSTSKENPPNDNRTQPDLPNDWS
jgi:DNA-binding NtrC family response regulator